MERQTFKQNKCIVKFPLIQNKILDDLNKISASNGLVEVLNFEIR